MTFSLQICVALVIALVVITNAQMINPNRPIIGVMTQPSSADLIKYGRSYIAASYVKYLEMAGAQVVPVFYNSTEAELKQLFGWLNGILLPGGGSSLDNTTLYQAGQYVYNLAIESFDKGDYFPIMGHCMGFEWLTMITSQNFNILSPVDAENYTLPLHFTDNAYNSKMFGRSTSQILDILSQQNVTMNNHQWSLSPSTYKNTPSLYKFYNVLSFNQDREGVPFISSMEGRIYPIFAIQWHAEKPQFEWNVQEVTSHSPDAILAMQSMGNFFVAQSRLSTHQFPSQTTLSQNLIYNYPVVYTESADPSFEECYFF